MFFDVQTTISNIEKRNSTFEIVIRNQGWYTKPKLKPVKIHYYTKPKRNRNLYFQKPKPKPKPLFSKTKT